MLRLTTLLFTCLLSLSYLGAQKIAHVNFGNLLSGMPETVEADTVLARLNRDMTAKGQQMVKELYEEVEILRRDADNIPPIQVREREAELTAKQQSIQQFEQEMALTIEAKRRELLAPIIEKTKAVIKEVADAGGYEIVIDSSVFGSVLFADDATDLTDAVRAALSN